MSKKLDVYAVDVSLKTAITGDKGNGLGALAEAIAIGFRVGSLSWGTERVTFRSIKSFVQNILDQFPSNKNIGTMMVLDHGYAIADTEYKSSKYGTTHNQAVVEFGKEVISHGNFATHKKTLEKLAPLFDSNSRVVFLNCMVGQDPALLKKFAEVWGCRIAGNTTTQMGLELGNINRGKWVTVTPKGQMTISSSHPIM